MSDATETNLYAAPESNVETIPQENQVRPEYHVTGAIKVAIFNVLSLGMYSLVWFYQQWRRQKIYGGDDCWPVARAIFQIFFVYALLLGIKNKAEDQKLEVKWGAGPMAALFIVASIFSNVFDRAFESLDISDAAATVIFLVLWFVPTIILTMAQNTINNIYRDTVEDMNANFTVVNWVSLLVLLGFWGLGIYGIMGV